MSTAYNPGGAYQGALGPNIVQTQQDSALKGLDLGQKMATFNALRGINLNDPGSVDKGIQGLIHVGALDQASAALNLGFQRYVIGARTQAVGSLMNALSGSGGDMGQPDNGQPQQSDQTQAQATPQQIAQQRAFITFGKQSADELASVAAQGNPEVTQQTAAQIKAHGQQMGIPDQFLDSALQVTGDSKADEAHFQGLSQNYGAWLDHQTMGGQGTGAQPDLHPTTMGAIGTADILSHPGVREAVATLAATGMDTKALSEALTAGRYSGVAAPGQVVVNNGVATYRAPYAPEHVGDLLINPNEPVGSNIIAGAPTFVKTAPGERPGVFNPVQAAGQPPAGGPPAAAPQVAAPAEPSKQQPPSPFVNGNATTLTPRTAALVPMTVPGANSIRMNAGILPQAEALIADLKAHGAPVGNLVGADDHSLDVAGTDTTSAHKVGLAFDDRAGAAWLAAHPAEARAIAAAHGARWGGDFKDVGPDPEHFTWAKVSGAPGGTVAWNPKTGAFDGGTEQGQQTANEAPLPGVTMGAAVPMYGAPTNVPGVPGKAQVSATGKVEPVANTTLGPNDILGLRAKNEGSPEYVSAKAGLAAWSALKQIAPNMTGPAAYEILDQFARAINPGAVARTGTIHNIVETLGLPTQIEGFFTSATGKGTLPPQARQQILDAVRAAVVSHWDQANQLNENAAQVASKYPDLGVGPDVVRLPLDPRPNRYLLVPPPASERVKGEVYDTPKGPHIWTGTGWQTAQR